MKCGWNSRIFLHMPLHYNPKIRVYSCECGKIQITDLDLAQNNEHLIALPN